LRALDGVDLALRAGELVVAIGPNGSGKSTLVKLLAGLLEPQSGSVLLEGRPLASFDPRERARRIAVVPQFLPALPEVRVEDFVLGGRYARLDRWKTIHREDRRIVADALEQCDAVDLLERGMTELSGGQRQRVLIARALAQEARVLLVDEPTNALDPEHQIRVFDLVARLRSTDRCALVVTHDLNLASQYATELVLLQNGRVAAQGDVEHVLQPAVLQPVYGENLYFGRWPADGERKDAGRPFVLPRRAD
jgi:iron complex transport system ATP-binding protein